ncbi:minor tail protein [Streptomyces phage Werner]|uniref:Minor tail protein n=1 Tax=Streptomyces phage Werner TaxID=2801898 RepID=A0A7U0GCU2_9CAUD|nr:minor tail protein [Streptomyces phage Werner]QFP95186.1 minor tail protein [Streptomyces phage Whatever]QQO39634.1 minor tail protein [Streptomyces phage Hippo]QYW07938.1 minor tail protein [Streptomyces phage Triste]QZE11087.1 minor tail protein [Streptomyces phage SarahRose]WNM66779.1 minor tail protein [Streptomyces phage BarryBee]
MATLRLENSLDSLNLNEVETKGYGVQALTGVSGLGLPPVAVQWIEGAGDGAVYRRSRTLARDIDIPLDIVGRNRADLKDHLSRLSLMLAGPCTLRMIEDDGTNWSTKVVRVGGGEYTYGVDSIGSTDLQTVITFRAGDPYWTSSQITSKQVGGDLTAAAFVSAFGSMPVAASQAIGSILLENTGDAVAYPVWEIFGPGNNFKAVSPSGEVLHWKGSLAAGQRLIVDTRQGTVVDSTGANRYAELAAAPRFWAIDPGISTAEASLLDVTNASKIVCSWRPRKWMVI